MKKSYDLTLDVSVRAGEEKLATAAIALVEQAVGILKVALGSVSLNVQMTPKAEPPAAPAPAPK